MQPAIPPSNADSQERASAAPTTRRHAVVACVTVGLFAALIRGLYLAELRGSLPLQVLIGDARAYDAWAWRIASGDWLGTEIFYQAPLYPYFLAAVYAAAGHDPNAARLLQAILSAGACGALAWAGFRFFRLRIGVIAGVALALYPPALFFDGLIQKASLDLCLTTLLVALLAEFQATARARWVFAAGVALGLLVSSRENSRLLYPIVVPWLWLCFRGAAPRRRAGWIALFSLGAGLALLPIAARNRWVGGEFVLTTSQFGPNFYIGNHTGASGRYDSLRPERGDPMHERDDATALAQEALGHAPSPTEVSDYWFHRTLAEIAAAPVSWLHLMAWKGFLTWNALEVADSEGTMVYAEHAPILRALSAVFGFGVLCPVAAFGVWMTRRDWRRLALLYGLLVASALSVALFYVFARYRLTMVPLLALFAAAGIDAIAALPRAWRSGAWKELFAPGIGLAALVALAVDWPLDHLRDDALGYLNLGTALLDAGRPADAIEPFERAIALRPGLAIGHLNLGLAFLAQHRTGEAAESFEEAVRQDPQMAIAHLDLAIARLTQKRPDDAERELGAALALDPRLAEAHVVLARTMIASGRAGDAVGHLREAVRLKPLDPDLHRELGVALLNLGDPGAAVGELREVVRLAPDSQPTAIRLAWLLATSQSDAARDGAEAVALAERVARSADPRDPVLLDTLAAAYAEVGRFDDAADAALRASASARQHGNPLLADQIAARAEGYRAHRPYREGRRPAPG